MLLWSAYGHAYDVIWDSPMTQRLAREVADCTPAGGAVVDLGCGTGLIAAELVRLGREVVGVDSSAVMLGRAVRLNRISTAVLSDASATPLADGRADAVVLCNLLHLHPDPAACLAEAVRVAKPGAPIVVTWPLDGVSNDGLVRADVALGRSLVGSLLADQLRRMVGLLALLLGSRRAAERDLREVLHRAARDGSIAVERDDRGVDGQRLLLLRTGPGRPERTGRDPGDREPCPREHPGERQHAERSGRGPTGSRPAP